MRHLSLLALFALAAVMPASDEMRPPDVMDGDIIVLSSDVVNTSVAILVAKQSQNPEQLSYRFIPIDPKSSGTTEELNAKLIKSGLHTTSGLIIANPFRLRWSIHTIGSGYLYGPDLTPSAWPDDLKVRIIKDNNSE